MDIIEKLEDRAVSYEQSGPSAHHTAALLREAKHEIEHTREGLKAAIRAAKLALFVIRKQGVMPNSSWEAGFDSDLKKAEAAVTLPNGER